MFTSNNYGTIWEDVMQATTDSLRQLRPCGLKVDVNITLFSKDFSTILPASCLAIEDTLSNSDLTNLAEFPPSN